MRIIGFSKKTVYRYLKRTDVPYSSVKYRDSYLDGYFNLIEEAFKANVRSNNVLILIKGKGYTGSESLLRVYLSKTKK